MYDDTVWDDVFSLGYKHASTDEECPYQCGTAEWREYCMGLDAGLDAEMVTHTAPDQYADYSKPLIA